MSYAYVVQMDVPPELEADFNRIYDTQHVPLLSKVPGVKSVSRYKLVETNKEGLAQYLAIYEIDGPDVAKSPAFREASDTGDWKPMIRPHTVNRSHSVYKKLI